MTVSLHLVGGVDTPGPASASAPAAVGRPTDTETRLRLAIDSTLAGVHARDLLTDEATWSPRLREIYDLADGEPASSATWLSRIHPEDRPRALTAMAAAMDPAGDGQYRATFRVVRRDGSVRWIEAHGQVTFDVVDALRRPVHLSGITYDVTERIETLAALRDNEERLRLAMQSASLGVFDWDVRSGALQWSEPTRRMFGVADGEPLSVQATMRRVHAEDRPALEAAVARALDPGGDGAFRMRYRVVWRCGTERWIDATGQVRFVEERAGRRVAARFCGVVADVTEAQRAMQALHDADHRKDEFLAMLAHELRNPLAPLVTAQQVIARCDGLDEPARAALAISQRQVRQLSRLVDDLLEVSRITRGMISLRIEPVALDDAIRQAAAACAAQLAARGQSLEVSLPPHAVTVRADPVRIAQVLENLLNNASKFTPDGGAIRVALDDPGGGEVRVQVADTGIGIEPAKLAAIFELFAQVDASLDRARGGLGIGLALVRRLVTLHGGRVWAASAGPGTGATFTVALPR